MKTITKEYVVYSFDELSEEAKSNAHGEYLRHCEVWPFADEARATMDEIERLFCVRLSNWSIDAWCPEYPDVHFCDNFGDLWEQDERKELSGNRARAFLWNNFGHVLLSGRYYSKWHGTKHAHSKFFFDRMYDGTCPLTGACFDNDALDPLAEFCFGVKWDEDAKKRVPSSRLLKSEKCITVEDVIRDCVHSMFRAFVDDVKYHESREYFEEGCEANEWTFTEDGTMMNY